MNLLYLSLNFPTLTSGGNLYSDLIFEFSKHGHKIDIVTLEERRLGKPTSLVQEAGCNILRVRAGNFFKVGLIEKGLGLMILPLLFRRAMARHLPDTRYDLILYGTPPLVFSGLIAGIKLRQPWAKTYLMLKDIFPQNAKDLGMIRNEWLFAHFRRQERRLYAISDVIGCMSPANQDFLLRQNPEIPPSRVEILPNTVTLLPEAGTAPDRSLRTRNQIPEDQLVVLWGGNMGKPQDMPFVLAIVEANRERAGIHFVLAGDGTERGWVAQRLQDKGLKNVTLLRSLPRAEYLALAKVCDIGLITLDARFTIPNFPSKVLAYMEASLPVLAALDSATDLGQMLRDADAGLWSPAGDPAAFQRNLEQLAADRELRVQMGVNGRRYLETHFTSSHAYRIITRMNPVASPQTPSA